MTDSRCGRVPVCAFRRAQAPRLPQCIVERFMPPGCSMRLPAFACDWHIAAPLTHARQVHGRAHARGRVRGRGLAPRMPPDRHHQEQAASGGGGGAW